MNAKKRDECQISSQKAVSKIRFSYSKKLRKQGGESLPQRGAQLGSDNGHYRNEDEDIDENCDHYWNFQNERVCDVFLSHATVFFIDPTRLIAPGYQADYNLKRQISISSTK